MGAPEPAASSSPEAHAGAVEAVRTLARASRLIERASDELSLAHYRVLSAIGSGDERASRIATRLAVGKPAMSAAVDALCRRGLVERLEVQGDQRAVALHLTPAGAELLDRVETEIVRRFETLWARTGNADRVVDALVALGQAMDDAFADRSGAGVDR
ncbi:MAG: MarR family winged helix-turn-helix transcriptional regulator [Actinomycetota bacterium]|jgi:DNA-binding MarR family transcriptional regulator|nr:MarR family winged helix-turn-helix transcriptional regulator [Actinomycetota bacterium]